MKIAINGFGRIGRLFFRASFGVPGFDIVAINDLGDVANLAYLLKYDTTYGQWNHDIKSDVTRNILIVDDHEIQFVQEKEMAKLPWSKYAVDIVVESTGLFESFTGSRGHITAGAKRVVITAPAKDEETNDARTVLNGVNEELFKTCIITSNGSCTTNSASPVVSILAKNPGIDKAILTTVHGYTATQRIQDGPDAKDWRRGRAGAENIVPSTTGAAVSVTRAVEILKEKFDGIALRVPVRVGSISDITFISSRVTTPEEVNQILREAAATSQWSSVLKVTEDPLVSSDIVGQPFGAIVDAGLTRVIGGNLVKVCSWYDNEWGYVHTLIEHVRKAGEFLT
ncbi:MAG: glyceraldehyde 3-phosphate dehydrogenase NAD-binding domain-containing protein [Patescibacteria group bacterium]